MVVINADMDLMAEVRKDVKASKVGPLTEIEEDMEEYAYAEEAWICK